MTTPTVASYEIIAVHPGYGSSVLTERDAEFGIEHALSHYTYWRDEARDDDRVGEIRLIANTSDGRRVRLA